MAKRISAKDAKDAKRYRGSLFFPACRQIQITSLGATLWCKIVELWERWQHARITMI
ncbi:MAG: hypothetical protein ACT6FE_03290 [Methanosarcinaceae archaeon]